MIYPLFQEISQWVNPRGTLRIYILLLFTKHKREKEGRRRHANEIYTFYL